MNKYLQTTKQNINSQDAVQKEKSEKAISRLTKPVNILKQICLQISSSTVSGKNSPLAKTNLFDNEIKRREICRAGGAEKVDWVGKLGR